MNGFCMGGLLKPNQPFVTVPLESGKFFAVPRHMAVYVARKHVAFGFWRVKT